MAISVSELRAGLDDRVGQRHDQEQDAQQQQARQGTGAGQRRSGRRRGTLWTARLRRHRIRW
jgi:hypothetical protein